MADFANRLRFLRNERHMTQQDVADQLNVGKMTISGYERGKRHPDFERLDALADLFDVSISYLLGYQDVRETYPRHDPSLPIYGSCDTPEETEEERVLNAYRSADAATKRAVRRVLDIE